jgi:hypothetical protein
VKGLDLDDYSKLAGIVGQSNRGIKYAPQFLSKKGAEFWIKKQRSKAKTPDEQAKWDRWAVQQADLDEDPDTPDNVLVFSDKYLGRLKSIDGYSLTSTKQKDVLRNYYDMNPDPAERRRIDTHKRAFLKAYFRKYPTAEAQLKNPITTFNQDVSGFAMIRQMCKEYLASLGLAVYSPTKDTGNLTAPHYMTILQKYTSRTYEQVVKFLLETKLGNKYDFENDPLNVKGKPMKRFINDMIGLKYVDVKKSVDEADIQSVKDVLTDIVKDIKDATIKIGVPLYNSTTKVYTIPINDPSVSALKLSGGKAPVQKLTEEQWFDLQSKYIKGLAGREETEEEKTMGAEAGESSGLGPSPDLLARISKQRQRINRGLAKRKGRAPGISLGGGSSRPSSTLPNIEEDEDIFEGEEQPPIPQRQLVRGPGIRVKAAARLPKRQANFGSSLARAARQDRR